MKKGDESKYPVFSPNERITTMLKKQRIIDEDETPHQMMVRVIETIFSVEDGTIDKNKLEKMKLQLADYIVNGLAILGTPTLTNAGRNKESALSSCVVIPTDLRNKEEATKTIKLYYKQNMGSGFDFTPYSNPLAMLKWINNLSAEETATGLYDRYIGNMGSLHISHPQIEEFIDAKKEDGVIKHFNISVDINDEFMSTVKKNGKFRLSNGKVIDARDLFHKIGENAWKTGDPGVLFLDRMNADNPVSYVGRYVSTPPCGEMGLTEGETCQFGYVNLAKFTENGVIDLEKLSEVTKLMVRCLDNAIEYSIKRYPTSVSTQITLKKRKVGIGVCGLADALIQSNIAYDSTQGTKFAREILSFINYTSKIESVKLAKERGSCLSMMDKNENLYYKDFLSKKYASEGTSTVSGNQWQALSDEIKNTGLLRNILTTALPPTGRASIILGVTTSIEPMFSILTDSGELNKSIEKLLLSLKLSDTESIISNAVSFGSFQNELRIPEDIKGVLKTAKEINVKGHLSMVGALAGIHGVIDEAASKTVNLPSSATIDDIEKTYLLAHEMGLKNVALYRDQSKIHQPKKL